MASPASRPSVLLIRLSAIGDIVMASGLPSSINHHFQGKAHITWLVEAPYASLVSNHPDVHDVITWPKGEWLALVKQKKYLSLFKSMLRFRHLLRSQQFDLVVDAQGLLKSAILAWFSGARRRVGFYSKEKSHWFLTEHHKKPLSDKISSEYRYLGSKFTKEAYALNLKLTDQGFTELNQALLNHGVTGAYIAVAPFTTRPQKHWLDEHWATVLEYLSNQNSTVLLLGGPGDNEHAGRLQQHNPGCINLAGELSLAASAAAIAQCQALIGVDTGLTHMGMAYNKPTVAIFGSTRPYTVTDNPHARILFTELECAPCKRRPTCDGKFDCMQALTPQTVISALHEVIG